MSRPKSAFVGSKKRLAAEQLASQYADDNDVGSRYLHDPEEYAKKKYEKSDPYFRNTRVTSCAFIVKKQDGQGKTCAIAYPLDKTGWKNPASYQNTMRSSELRSVAG